MKITEQYLRQVIRQTLVKTLKEEYGEGETEDDLENQLQGLTSKKQGVESKLKYRNVYAGLEQVHSIMQGSLPQDIKIKEANEIIESLLRGIESGHLQLK